MNDTVEVEGLSALLRDDPRHGGPRARVPEEVAAVGVEELVLTLRYNGVEYRAFIAGTEEAAKRIGFRRGDGEWQGWAMKLTEHFPHGKRIAVVSPLPTLEAAIVSAICRVYSMDYKSSQGGWPSQHTQ